MVHHFEWLIWIRNSMVQKFLAKTLPYLTRFAALTRFQAFINVGHIIDSLFAAIDPARPSVRPHLTILVTTNLIRPNLRTSKPCIKRWNCIMQYMRWQLPHVMTVKKNSFRVIIIQWRFNWHYLCYLIILVMKISVNTSSWFNFTNNIILYKQ